MEEQSDQNDKEEVVFYRKALEKGRDWASTEAKFISDLDIRSEGKIGESHFDVLEVDFANKELSYGRGLWLPTYFR